MQLIHTWGIGYDNSNNVNNSNTSSIYKLYKKSSRQQLRKHPSKFDSTNSERCKQHPSNSCYMCAWPTVCWEHPPHNLMSIRTNYRLAQKFSALLKTSLKTWHVNDTFIHMQSSTCVSIPASIPLTVML